MNVHKSRGKRIFEIVHWPFELPPNQHQHTGPFGWHKWCSLARPSKGQCTISKILSSLIFSSFIEQNIFFPEICFAYTISEPKFTVWFESWRAPGSTQARGRGLFIQTGWPMSVAVFGVKHRLQVDVLAVDGQDMFQTRFVCGWSMYVMVHQIVEFVAAVSKFSDIFTKKINKNVNTLYSQVPNKRSGVKITEK